VTSDGLTVDHNTSLYTVDKTISSFNATNGVYVNGNAGGWISLSGDGSQRNHIRIHGQTSASGEIMAFNTAATQRMVIAANGDISFYNSAGSSAKLFWDASAESLGIGTSSLTTSEGSNIELSSATSSRIILDSTGTGGRKYTMASGGNGSLDFYDYDASAYRMRIDSSGNVGIGVGNSKEAMIQSTNSGRVESNPAYSFNGDLDTGMFNPQTDNTIAFATGGTEALRIDSSQNVLVGHTSIGDYTTTVGSSLRASGFSTHTADDNASLLLNRLTSDGDIVLFRKDNTTIGSIGVESNTHLVISTQRNGGSLIFEGNDTGGSDTRLAMENNTGSEAFRPYNSYSDSKYDLGSGSRRFKNLYLSSGIYLGGAGAANHLDDYETGTWTPTAGKSSSDPTASYSERLGSYVKIGDLVHASFDINISSISGGSGTIRIKGLPFTVSSSTNNFSGYGVAQWRSIGAIPAGAAGTQLKGYTERGESYIHVQYDHSGSNGFGTQGNATSWQTGRVTGYVIYPAQS
jgi:hypothetical protein